MNDTPGTTALTITTVTNFSLVPRSLTEAMELAKLISDSDLAPKDYKGKPGNVLIAVQMGSEVGLSPMSAIQSIAVINGKPGLYGDVGKALLLRHGFIVEEDDVEIIRQTGMGRCRITRPGHPPCERTFSLEAAKAAGLLNKSGPWSQYKERQMAWRAFWFAARDIAADVLKGLHGAEEIHDLPEKDITPMGRPQIAERAELDDATFTKNFPSWEKLLSTGKRTHDEIIGKILSKAKLSDAHRKKILAVKAPETGGSGDDGKVSPDQSVSFAVVEERLRKAENREMRDLAADFIKGVADEAQRKELTDLYRELNEGGAQ